MSSDRDASAPPERRASSIRMSLLPVPAMPSTNQTSSTFTCSRGSAKKRRSGVGSSPFTQRADDHPVRVHDAGAPRPAAVQPDSRPPPARRHRSATAPRARASSPAGGRRDSALERLGELAEHPVVLDVEARDPRHRGVAFAERESHLEEGVEIELEAAVPLRHHQPEDARAAQRVDHRVRRPPQRSASAACSARSGVSARARATSSAAVIGVLPRRAGRSLPRSRV